MFEPNWYAVVGAAVLAMVLGFLWYGPLFGKQWMAMMGFTCEHVEEAKKKGVGKSYALMALGSLLMAYVLSWTVLSVGMIRPLLGVTHVGLLAGFWSWLGFVAPITLGSVLWEGKPWKLWALNSGYYLVALCMMGVLLAHY
ncbi:MAG: hypothetical protein COV10_02580 [Candidatus Vogelbacteria bacterium CG10_big_fil_rev_8_21_14_0_10_51_16]|uniref:DUF1761 domain-containing protein n=1 Tax=Candidatus Vogelbacteria bacterium CG10_big_fil_rev_8_21_14_0_10_51_16 TaxID=1975045 RepID=A0A2H0RED3_9BACT|nr:MAG: hypothetical protein COV10_02580 [Candidatus Vogelbacteria bacterium CG10_big_fil_rev_8_21_14_0_10_51_16]